MTFTSAASNLVPEISGDTYQVFVYDRNSRTIRVVSANDAGNQANGISGASTISGDGSVVAFDSDATNLVSGDTNDRTDVFVSQRTPGTSVTIGGGDGNDVISGGAGADVLDGGPGIDTVSYYAATCGCLDRSGRGHGNCRLGTDTVLNFENAIGSAYNDTIAGTDGPNVLDGGGGANTVSYADHPRAVDIDLSAGTASDGVATDTLLNFQSAIGSAYNDTIIGGSSAGVLDGGGGVNTLSYAAALNVVYIDLEWSVADKGNAIDTVMNFTNVVGSPFDDAISPNDRNGQAGNATLDGGGGNNTISFYCAPQGVSVDLFNGTATDGSATDTLKNFSNVPGVRLARTGLLSEVERDRSSGLGRPV